MIAGFGRYLFFRQPSAQFSCDCCRCDILRVTFGFWVAEVCSRSFKIKLVCFECLIKSQFLATRDKFKTLSSEHCVTEKLSRHQMPCLHHVSMQHEQGEQHISTCTVILSSKQGTDAGRIPSFYGLLYRNVVDYLGVID